MNSDSRLVIAAFILAMPVPARGDDPLPDFAPTLRAGGRGGVVALIDPRSPGVGAELSGTLGVRFAIRWSLVADASADVGWWNMSASPFLFGWSATAGVEYTARDAFARGSSWQAAVLFGPWMAAVCDSKFSARCQAVMPCATLRFSLLPESGHTSTGARASWDVGVAATLGDDLGVGELVGRVAVFAGFEAF